MVPRRCSLKRKVYPKEFKLEAVRMVIEDDLSQADVARQLDIPPSALCNWVSEAQAHGDDSFPGKGRISDKDAEIRRLKRELARERAEKDFLKKAISYFGKKRS
jgi:transposase